MRHHHVLLASSFCFLAAAGSAVADPPSPSAAWKTGDWWDLRVELADKTFFVLHAFVSGVEKAGGAACWQVTFLAGDKAPGHLKGLRYRLLVDQKTGQPVHAYRLAEKMDVAIESVGHDRFVTGAPEGFPLEWIIAADSAGKGPGLARHIKVQRHKAADHVVFEMVLIDKGVEELKISQQWGKDEKWWHTYERKVKGATTLRSRRLNAPPLTTKVAGGGPTKLDPALAKKAPKPLPLLRADPKLKAKVNIDGTNPKLDTILAKLQDATGLTIAMDPSLRFHDPDLGKVHLGDFPAFGSMEMLAFFDLEEGDWQQTETGYLLTAKRSLRERPRTFWEKPWPYVTLALLGLVLVVGVWRVWKKRSAQGKKGPEVSAAEGTKT